MLARRIIYILLLIASIVTFVLTDNGIALFFLLCFVAYPVLAYSLLIAASKRVKFAYETRESCIRGNDLQITMQVGLKPRFLAGYASVVAIIENTTFGKVSRENFIFRTLSNIPRVYNYSSSDSGRISVHFKAVKLMDLFGICSVSVSCNKYKEAIVSPVIYDKLDASMGAKTREAMFGDISLPMKGNDHTEIFNVRDYEPGDSLNTVHWKLSGKFGSLISKEFGTTDDHRTLILVDLSRVKGDNVATDEQLNGVLDISVSISNALKADHYIHSVGWFNDGEFVCAEVADNNTFVSMVNNLMSIKADSGNAESLFYFRRTSECAAFTKIIMVTPYILTDRIHSYADMDVTAIAIGDEVSEFREGSARVINITREHLSELLASIKL